MIFVDTSAWFAVFSRRDANHAAAAVAIRTFREPLVTTDYVVDETLTLLRARGESRRSLAFGCRIIDGGWARLAHITEADFADAWRLYPSFHDKQWSFTDCTSRIVIQRLGIPRAFAFDDHFRQFGVVAVLP